MMGDGYGMCPALLGESVIWGLSDGAGQFVTVQLIFNSCISKRSVEFGGISFPNPRSP